MGGGVLGHPSAAPAPHRPAPPQKAESEELETQKPQVKLRRTVSEVVRPASTPPIIASAIKDDDDEDRIIAELEVSVAGGVLGGDAPGHPQEQLQERPASSSAAVAVPVLAPSPAGARCHRDRQRGAIASCPGGAGVVRCGGAPWLGHVTSGEQPMPPSLPAVLSPRPGGALCVSAPSLPPPTLRV